MGRGSGRGAVMSGEITVRDGAHVSDDVVVPAGWERRQWATFCGLLRRGWGGRFEPADANAYAILLDGYGPGETVEALKRILHAGERRRWQGRPAASELLGELGRDPSQPTFDEAYRLIFDRGGILSARPAQRVFHDVEDGETVIPASMLKSRAEREAREQACAAAHPLVGAFVTRMGVDYLRGLELEDPEWGPARRTELRKSWEAHVEAFDGRKVAALAAGERRGLRAFDPLAALGIATAGELEA